MVARRRVRRFNNRRSPIPSTGKGVRTQGFGWLFAFYIASRARCSSLDWPRCRGRSAVPLGYGIVGDAVFPPRECGSPRSRLEGQAVAVRLFSEARFSVVKSERFMCWWRGAEARRVRFVRARAEITRWLLRRTARFGVSIGRGPGVVRWCR